MTVNRTYLLANIIMIGSILSTDWAFSRNGHREKVLYHVLLLKWSETGSQRERDDLIELFEGLPGKVEGFEEVEILNLDGSSRQFNAAVIMSFSSSHGLEAYKQHEDRGQIRQMARDVIDGYASYDF